MQIINSMNWIVIIKNAGLSSPPDTNTKFIINIKLNDQYSNVNENKYKGGLVGLKMKIM